MKTTKVVDITICDSCGREQTRLDPCKGCSKELCRECSECFSVKVTRSTPNGKDSGYIIHTLKEFDYTGYYCPACSDKISSTLIAAGLVKKQT